MLRCLLLCLLLTTLSAAAELVVLPDGTVLSSNRDEVRLWRGQQLLWRLPVAGLDDLAVSQDGKTLALTWGEEEVGLYDLPSGKPRWKARNERPRQRDREAAAYRLDLSPDGRWLLTRGMMFGDTDPFARLWDNGRVVLKLPVDTELAWSSDNRLVRLDGPTVFLTSGPGWREAQGLLQDSPVLHLAQRQGQLVTLSSILREGDQAEVRAWIWDLATGKLAQTLAIEAPADELEISADGTRLLACHQPTMKYQLWDLPGRRLVGTGMGRPSFAGPTVVVNQPQSVRALRAEDGVETARIPWDGPRQASPDGQVLATFGLGSGPVEVWDLATGRKLGSIPRAEAVAFSPDGATLAVARPDGTVALYEARTLAPR